MKFTLYNLLFGILILTSSSFVAAAGPKEKPREDTAYQSMPLENLVYLDNIHNQTNKTAVIKYGYDERSTNIIATLKPREKLDLEMQLPLLEGLAPIDQPEQGLMLHGGILSVYDQNDLQTALLKLFIRRFSRNNDDGSKDVGTNFILLHNPDTQLEQRIDGQNFTYDELQTDERDQYDLDLELIGNNFEFSTMHFLADED